MKKVAVYNLEGKKVRDIELNDDVFGLDSNDALVHQVYVAQSANRRSGSAHTKIRSERRGGGKKPWKQKGTGNARTGSIRNPIWRGGGITFGPLKNRNFKKNINEKMKRKALMIVLSEKVRNDKVKVIETLIIPDKKTKNVSKMIKAIEVDKSILMSFSSEESDQYVAARNIEKVRTIPTEQLNVYDLLNSEYLVVSQESIDQLTKKYTA